LTDVTAKHMICDFRPMLCWKGASQFDREVGDAQSRIESVHVASGHNRRSGACVDTARARAAAIGRRRIRLDLDRDQLVAQKKPRPHGLVDETSILADPAQPGAARVTPLQQWRSIDADLV